MKLLFLFALASNLSFAQDGVLVKDFTITRESPDRSTETGDYWDAVSSTDGRCKLQRSTNKPRDWNYLQVRGPGYDLDVAYQSRGKDTFISTANKAYRSCALEKSADSQSKTATVTCRNVYDKLTFSLTVDNSGSLVQVTSAHRNFGSSDSYPLPTFTSGKLDCRF